MKVKCCWLLFILFPSFMNAQDISLFKKEIFISKGDTLPYRILLPENYNAKTKYPLIVFLHGSGERGNDNEAQLIHGSSLFLREDIRKKFPAIVVFPQCPGDDYWANVDKSKIGDTQIFTYKTTGEPTPAMTQLLKLTDQLMSRSDIDKTRLYVVGLSMGGMGTFELLRRKPNVFAAAISICGGDNPENTKKYSQVSLWIFHGENDDVVNTDYSKAVAEKLKSLNADVKYTSYPGVKHDSWNNVFAEPDLLPWLFSKHR